MKKFCLAAMLSFAGMYGFAQKTGHNPVLDKNFPDPTVIRAEGKYYAYATNSNAHIQVASSTDLMHWQPEGDALPQPPVWADRDFWAPHVLYDPVMKKYVMFYSGESTDKNTGKCLGVAYADKPTGPFVDKGTPLICGDGFVNIDPMAFVDPASGKKLLYWGSGFEPIRVQEMSDDWSAFKPGTTAKMVVWPGKDKVPADGKSYDRLIEGAWVTRHKGWYYLYYSGDNCCGENAHYAVMVARSKDPFGPFERFGEKHNNGSSVILGLNEEWLAPGHNSIVKDDRGREYIAYHAIPANKKNGGRVMLIDRITYRKGWPVVVPSK